jgi:TonB family protein
MKTTLFSLVLAALFAAPAGAVTITLSPLVLAPNTLPPTLVTTCASPNVSAKVDEPFYDMPGIAAMQGASGTSTVQIDLNPTGELTAQTLYASSGNEWLDRAAMQSARMSHFSAEVRNCSHVAGTYLFAVAF